MKEENFLDSSMSGLVWQGVCVGTSNYGVQPSISKKPIISHSKWNHRSIDNVFSMTLKDVSLVFKGSCPKRKLRALSVTHLDSQSPKNPTSRVKLLPGNFLRI